MSDYPLDYDVMNRDDATTSGNGDGLYPLSSVKIVTRDVCEMIGLYKDAAGIYRRTMQILGKNKDA